MCRPEKPLTTSNKALRELQEWLRDQRSRTGQGYRALAVRAGCHATTLQRAACGETVPKLQTVLNYARACDASPEEARVLWRRARYEATRRARGSRGQSVPRSDYIRDFVDLSAALQDLYEKAGSPTLRTMEQRAGAYGVLSRSTAHRIVTKQAVPHNLEQLQAYLRACEVPEVEWPSWEAAWTRARRHERRDKPVKPFLEAVEYLTREGRAHGLNVFVETRRRPQPSPSVDSPQRAPRRRRGKRTTPPGVQGQLPISLGVSVTESVPALF